MPYNRPRTCSPPGHPNITLRTAPMTPFDGAIAAARTCYSPRVIATSEVTEPQRDLIGGLTFDAGHHTVYQHAHFEFGLENISRQFVWAFLHSYPFYNSEQSSQRYVKLKEPRAFVPPIAGEALDVYESAVVRAWDRYAELSALLKDDAHAILKELRYVRPTTNPERLKQIEKDAEKRAIETARYVIPIGAFTSMVHTVSGIVLHRLLADDEHRRHAVRDAPGHLRDGAPGEGVGPATSSRRSGPGRLTSDDVPETSLPRPRSGGDRYAAEFDARLNGRWSHLRDASPDAEEIVAEAVRSVFGLTRDEMSDDEALDRVMNPARNRYRLDILNVSYHSPLMRALHHATYVFEKRLSHTADSQDQRHRMVPASRPLMTFSDTQQPDYITPRLIAANARAQGGVRRRRCGRRGRRRTGCSSLACRSSSRSTCCRTPRRCASSSRVRCSRCCTSGRCAPASTRRKRSTWRRWTRSTRCARCIRASAATWARHA